MGAWFCAGVIPMLLSSCNHWDVAGSYERRTWMILDTAHLSLSILGLLCACRWEEKHGAPYVATATGFCLACDSLMMITVAQKYYLDKHQNTWLNFVVEFMCVFAIYSTAASPTIRKKKPQLTQYISIKFFCLSMYYYTDPLANEYCKLII